jgi:hypothetical protein
MNTKPEMVPVILVDGVLHSGREFSFSVRADRGDTLTETAETLTFVSGTTGQEVSVMRSQIAVISRLTRLVAKEDYKPISATASVRESLDSRLRSRGGTRPMHLLKQELHWQ